MRTAAGATPLRRSSRRGLPEEKEMPALPVFLVSDRICVFDHRADDVRTVAWIGNSFDLEASCDGLLVLSKLDAHGESRSRTLLVCNPATHEQASLRCPPWDFHIIGMYAHRPTGEYRLLLQRTIDMKSSEGQTNCYVLSLGSKEPPRYIGWPETAAWCFDIPVRVHDSLHWYSEIYLSETSPQHERDCKPVIVFDTVAESFRRMCAPIVSTQANIFDMDGMLGIYRRNYATKEIDVEPFLKEKETIDIWVLWNYESEVWDKKYRIKLPLAKIRDQFWNHDEYCLDVVAGDDGVLVLLLLGQYLTRVDSDGELLGNFNIGEKPRMTKWRLKQSLVQHTFFSALEGYAVKFCIGG